ncbi:MAG: TlpA family protein disulfide reductase [Bacteroidales bacterium]|nr:TlpA family protein disulfide reductase [Bacteroidales bacterium]
MKRFLLILPLLACLSACGPKGNSYLVKGTLTDELAEIPDAKLVLIQSDGSREDIAFEAGKFTVTGEADPQTTCRIAYLVNDRPAGDNTLAFFVPEKGVIKVNLGQKPTVSGGKLNKTLTAYTDGINKVIEDFQAEVSNLIDSLGRENATDALMAANEKASSDILALSEKTFEANAGNVVGLEALKNIISDLTPEELDAHLEKAADFIKESDIVKKTKARWSAEQATAEGMMFTDFSGKTPDGKEIKLSDYVGKGKYTLVDFWASWCGPCREEIPNVKAIFEKYGKKINVVGVAVWDGDNTKSLATMKDLGMKWSQIFVGEDRTPTELYGIRGIPHIILFAPDGTICKRNLRGEEMMEAVEAVMK